jgi:hypothetical protein
MKKINQVFLVIQWEGGQSYIHGPYESATVAEANITNIGTSAVILGPMPIVKSFDLNEKFPSTAS